MFSVSDKEIQKRIKKGKQLIDRHEVIFFDVFNTLLARDCENPSDIFLLVEQRFNEIATFTPLRDFKHMRQDAQKICAEKILAPKLDEIYEQVPLSVDQKSKLKALEIEVEEELSTRKSTGYSLYQYAKSLGKKIIAVSDMYLGAAVIRKMLLSAGYEICSVIVSCDHRAEKYNGKLFQVAMNEYAVEKKQIVHFGDNIISDIIGAFRAGIACLWIPPENKLAYLKPCGDAFANHYLIPFIANRIALIENKSTALGYETCGPLIVGFCQWLHEVIKKEQYSKILFCARDVKQTYEVYKKRLAVYRGCIRFSRHLLLRDEFLCQIGESVSRRLCRYFQTDFTAAGKIHAYRRIIQCHLLYPEYPDNDACLETYRT